MIKKFNIIEVICFHRANRRNEKKKKLFLNAIEREIFGIWMKGERRRRRRRNNKKMIMKKNKNIFQ